MSESKEHWTTGMILLLLAGQAVGPHWLTLILGAAGSVELILSATTWSYWGTFKK